LTGKYHGHAPAEGGRMAVDAMKEFVPEEQRIGRILKAVKVVADEVGRSMAQVAIAWLRHRPTPVIPLLGARKLAQLQDNLAALDLTLSADQVRGLDDASGIESGFPQSLYGHTM